MTETRHQEIGRLHDANASVPINTTINACANILVRIYDSTTEALDMIEPSLEIFTEMKILGFNYRNIHSTITKASRIRKATIWDAISWFANYRFNNATKRR